MEFWSLCYVIKLFSREKENSVKKKQKHWIRPGSTKQWRLQFLNDEVVTDK